MANKNLNTEKVMFLSGLDSKVTELRKKGGAILGAFYLTSDTKRLYIGTEGTIKNESGQDVTAIIPEPVNQGVITVATEAGLPAEGLLSNIPGQFYYVENISALCVYSKGKWVQINPDTTIASNSFSMSKDETAKKITVTNIITDSNKIEHQGAFEIIQGDGIEISTDGKTLTISASGTGGVTFTLTTTQGTDNSSAKLNQHSEVIGPDGKTVISTHDESVTFKAGKEIESIVAGTQEITINAKKQTLKQTDGLTFSADTTAGFTLNAEHRNGDTSTSNKLDPTITIGKTGSKSEAIHYVNGNADLDVYTVAQADAKITEEINKKIAAANAMTFKGTVGGTSRALPAITECSIGDTYKVAGTLTSADLAKISSINGTVKVGDLLIAYGEKEDANGKLSAKDSYVHVPSGNEYEVKVNLVTNGIELTDDAENATTLGGIKVAAGKQIAVADTEAGKVKTVTVNHSDITTATETATAEEYGTLTDNKRSKTITVVKSIEVDNGHVTKIVTDQEVIDDTDVALDKVTQTATAATPDKDIKVETIVHDKKGRTTTGGNFNFKSDTIKLAADGASMSMNLVWGSF